MRQIDRHAHSYAQLLATLGKFASRTEVVDEILYAAHEGRGAPAVSSGAKGFALTVQSLHMFFVLL